MNNYDPRLQEADLDRSAASTTSEPSIAGDSVDAGATAPPPSASAPDWPTSATTPRQERKPKARRLLTKKKCRSIVAAAVLVPMIGLSVGLLESPRRQQRNRRPVATPPVLSEPAADPTRGLAQPPVDPRARSPACPSRASP
jgi:hypothetical protein